MEKELPHRSFFRSARDFGKMLENPSENCTMNKNLQTSVVVVFSHLIATQMRQITIPPWRIITKDHMIKNIKKPRGLLFKIVD